MRQNHHASISRVTPRMRSCLIVSSSWPLGSRARRVCALLKGLGAHFSGSGGAGIQRESGIVDFSCVFKECVIGTWLQSLAVGQERADVVGGLLGRVEPGQ